MIRLTALTLLTIASLFGCGPERYSWNERTTVTVRTPSGIVTGTSVIEFRAAWCEDGCGLAGDIGYQWDYTGEAVVVEVLPDRYLFALPQTYLADAHRYALEVLGNTGERLRIARSLTEPVVLPVEAYPEMLTFLERGVVESLREVDPANMGDSFGEDFEITSITLEVTRDRATQPRVASLLNFLCDAPRNDFGRLPPLYVRSHEGERRNAVGFFDFGRNIQVCEED